MIKIDSDKKLTGFYRKITLSKTKYLEVQKKANSLITNDCNFFLSRMYLASDDGSQNTFVYQPTLDMLELKNTKLMIMFLVGNQIEYIILNLSHYILLSYVA